MKCGDLCDVGLFHEHSKHCENRETDTDSQEKSLNSQRKKEKTYQKRGLEEQFTVETDLENNMKKRRIEQRSNVKDSGETISLKKRKYRIRRCHCTFRQNQNRRNMLSNYWIS